MKKAHYPKVLLALSITAVIFFIALYYSPFRPGKDFPDAVRFVKMVQKQTEIKIQKRVEDLQTDKIRSPAKIPMRQEARLSDGCGTNWNYLIETDLLNIEQDLINQIQLFSSDCSKQMKAELKLAQIQTFLKECQDKLTEKSLTQIEQVCLPLLPPLRSYLMRVMGSNIEDLQDLSPAELAAQLAGGHLDLAHTALEKINRNIALSDALMEKDRDVYAAYKSKLLGLLMKEIRFGEKIEAETYDELYVELMGFQGQELTENEEDIDTFVSALELESIDKDLVHIPFLRAQALGDNERLYQMAAEYEEAFPDSYLGPLYQSEALWAVGDKASAMIALKRAFGDKVSNEAALEVLQQRSRQSALERLSEMSIE